MMQVRPGDRNVDSSGWIAGFAWFLAGWAVLALQVFWFLRDGLWTPMSIIDVGVMIVKENASFYSWLVFPMSWTGLHTVLSYIPVSLLGILGGFGIMAAANRYD